MPVYSHSRLSVYETCPRQDRYQYIERLPAFESLEESTAVRVSRFEG